MNAISSRHPHTSTISFYSPQRLRDTRGSLQLPSHPICAPKFSPGVAGTEPPLSARRARGPLGLVVSPLLRRRRRRIGGGGTTRPLSQWPPSRAATSGPAEAQGDRRCPGNGPGRPWRRGGPRAEGSLRGCVRRGRFFGEAAFQHPPRHPHLHRQSGELRGWRLTGAGDGVARGEIVRGFLSPHSFPPPFSVKSKQRSFAFQGVWGYKVLEIAGPAALDRVENAGREKAVNGEKRSVCRPHVSSQRRLYIF